MSKILFNIILQSKISVSKIERKVIFQSFFFSFQKFSFPGHEKRFYCQQICFCDYLLSLSSPYTIFSVPLVLSVINSIKRFRIAFPIGKYGHTPSTHPVRKNPSNDKNHVGKYCSRQKINYLPQTNRQIFNQLTQTNNE